MSSPPATAPPSQTWPWIRYAGPVAAVVAAAAYLAHAASSLPNHLGSYLFVCASVAAVAFGVAMLPRRISDRTALILMVVATQATLLLLRHFLRFSPDIGDSRWVIEFAATNTVFPRWLGISYLTASSYSLGSTLTLTSGTFGWLFPTPEVFVRFLLGALVLAQSLHLLLTTRHMRVIAFVVLSPFGLLFLSGHIEIYMVIALYMVQCCEALRRNENGPIVLGAFIGGLGVLYYGAWHLCLGLLAVALLRNPRWFLAVLASFAVVLLVGIDLLWPGDLRNFAERLNSYSPAGLQLLVPEYHIGAGTGMFWRDGFLFSEGHLKIVGRALFVGLAPLLILLAVAVLKTRNWRLLSGVRPFRLSHFGWIAFAAMAMTFVILMIPRLGIERDIDLFAISSVALIYVGASAMESVWRPLGLRLTVAAYALYSALTFGLLLF